MATNVYLRRKYSYIGIAYSMSYHSGNQLIDPYFLFQKAQLQQGMHIADFGCGRTGHLVFPAAPILGERGVIYAVDIMKEVLTLIEKRAKMDGFVNVHPVWSNIESVGMTGIPMNSLDVVFLINTLSQCKNREAALEEAARLLKEKGRLLIADWSEAGLPFGPKKEEFVDFNAVKQWAQNHHFLVQEEFTVGKYHYGMVLYRHG